MNREKRDIRAVFLIFTGIFSLVAYKHYPSFLSYAFITAGILLLGTLVVSPLTLRPLFKAWLKVAHVIGQINTQILLFIVFVFIFVPVGILLRLFGSDPMQRAMKQANKRSYWEPYEVAGVKNKSRYERQF